MSLVKVIKELPKCALEEHDILPSGAVHAQILPEHLICSAWDRLLYASQ